MVFISKGKRQLSVHVWRNRLIVKLIPLASRELMSCRNALGMESTVNFQNCKVVKVAREMFYHLLYRRCRKAFINH